MEPSSSSQASSAAVALTWRSDRRLVGFMVYVALLSLAFMGPLHALVRYALKEELHSHALLIPFVSLYLAALKRDSLPGERRGAPAWAAAFAVAAAAVCFLSGLTAAGELSHNDQVALPVAGYVLLLVAGGFLFLGVSWMRRLAFPFALLVFMIPLPDLVTTTLEDTLMRASVGLAEILFQWTGTPVFRSGQVVELPGMTLEVAPECSGIRSSMVLFITSLIASHLFLSSAWHRGFLVAAVIPLGILRNAVRVVVIGLLCVHRGPQMIDSWIHHYGGPVFFAGSLVPLLLLAAWFRRREVAVANQQAAGFSNQVEGNNV